MMNKITKRATSWTLVALGIGSACGQELMRLKGERCWSEDMRYVECASIVMEDFFYNEPPSVDEEYSHIVFVKFLRPPSELIDTKVELPRDSGMVSLWYQRSSAGNWSDPKRVIATGTLGILKANKSRVTVWHDLSFIATGDRISEFRLTGKRTMRRGKPPWRITHINW